MKNILILALLALTFFACKDDEGTETIEGVYIGSLTIIDHYNPTVNTDVFEDESSTITISDCSSDCIELNIQHDWGSVTTTGTASLQSSFFSIDLDPVLAEDEMDNLSGFTNTSGVFDFENNNLTFTLNVTDNSAPRGTDSVYQFSGERQ